jgi:glycine cleavage system transcriptional repressor
MPQQLVVTAIGADRTGIVSQLARLVSDCNCNIVDSRMAIFGNEFTFIMLLSGDPVAISKVEVMLPSSAFELDLLTMSKRTSGRSMPALSAPYIIEYTGADRVGTLGAISSLLAEQQVNIGALRSETLPATDEQEAQTHTVMTVNLPLSLDPDKLKRLLQAKFTQLQLNGKFTTQS